MNDDTEINFKGLLDGKTVLTNEMFEKLASDSAKYNGVITVLEYLTTVWSDKNGVPLDIIQEILSKFGREAKE